MDFAFDIGLLLPPPLLFEEAEATHIVEARVEGSKWVLTLFESCEPSRKIRDTHHSSCLLSRATRKCSSRCESCDDEFHSLIFRDHGLSKSIRSILVNSVMALALQYQNFHNCSNLNILDWTNFFVCINWCVFIWILPVSGRCMLFEHRSALSPSIVIISSCNIVVFLSRSDGRISPLYGDIQFLFVDRIELKSFKFWNIRFPDACGSLGIPTNDLRFSCFTWFFGDRAGSQHEQSVLYSKSILRSPLSGWCLDCFSSWIFHGRTGLPTWSTGCPEFFKISHHLWYTKIPLATKIGSISLISRAFFSESQECPVSIVKIWGIVLELLWRKNTRIFVNLSFPIRHHWTLTWRLLDNLENVQCFRSCEGLPLEINRISN